MVLANSFLAARDGLPRCCRILLGCVSAGLGAFKFAIGIIGYACFQPTDETVRRTDTGSGHPSHAPGDHEFHGEHFSEEPGEWLRPHGPVQDELERAPSGIPFAGIPQVRGFRRQLLRFRKVPGSSGKDVQSREVG